MKIKTALTITALTIILFSGLILSADAQQYGGTFCYPRQGCTGTSTAPTYGQVLVGNAGGTYTLTATSSLGIAGGAATLSGGSPNTLTYWTSASTLAATSSPTIGYLTATSTTATSSIAGSLTIGNLTKANIGIGTAADSIYTISARKDGGNLNVLFQQDCNPTTNVGRVELISDVDIWLSAPCASGIESDGRVTLSSDDAYNTTSSMRFQIGNPYPFDWWSGGVRRAFLDGSSNFSAGTINATSTGNATSTFAANATVAGRVGIGNTNPLQKLDVSGDIRVRANSPGVTTLQIGNSNNATITGIYDEVGGTYLAGINTIGNLQFGSYDGNDGIYKTGSGVASASYGVATNTPSTNFRLSVNGGIYATATSSLATTTSPCFTSNGTTCLGGNGTVDSGLTGQSAYYAADGTTVGPTSLVGIDVFNDRVGINTLAPQSPFHVSVDGVAVATNMYSSTSDSLLLSNSGASFARLLTSSNTGSTAAGLFLMKSRGTADTPLDVVSGDTLGSLSVQGWANSNRRLSSRILATVGDTVSGSVIPGKIEFQTANSAGTLTTGLTVSPRQFVGVGSGTTTPGAQLAVAGDAIVDGNVRASSFTATSSTASVLPYASSTAQTVSGSLYLGSLNGPLQANAGLVSATTSVGVRYGGTGLSSTPSFGQMLVGNGSGYTLTATSSLGIPTYSPLVMYNNPADGSTLTASTTRVGYLLIDLPGTINTLNINFANSPQDGDLLVVATDQAILTVGFANGAYTSAPISLAAGDHVSFIYSSLGNIWFRTD